MPNFGSQQTFLSIKLISRRTFVIRKIPFWATCCNYDFCLLIYFSQALFFVIYCCGNSFVDPSQFLLRRLRLEPDREACVGRKKKRAKRVFLLRDLWVISSFSFFFDRTAATALESKSLHIGAANKINKKFPFQLRVERNISGECDYDGWPQQRAEETFQFSLDSGRSRDGHHATLHDLTRLPSHEKGKQNASDEDVTRLFQKQIIAGLRGSDKRKMRSQGRTDSICRGIFIAPRIDLLSISQLFHAMAWAKWKVNGAVGGHNQPERFKLRVNWQFLVCNLQPAELSCAIVPKRALKIKNAI